MKELSDSGDYFVYGANGIIGRYTNYNHENSEVVIACRGATCGAVNVTLPKSWINGNAMVVKPRNDLVCHDYLVAFLKVFNWKKVISGSAQPQITRKNLATVLFPLPPLEEQHRIVAKLNQLCDQIESAENAYKELSGSLSERFKQLCLEKVVQGKLVPQLESEPEMAQIGETPEDVAFDIPAKWKWMSLENVLTEISDGSHNPPPNSGKGIPVLSAKNVNNGIIDAQLITRWTTEEQWAIEDKKIHIEPGDVLLTIVGTIGRTAVVSNDMPKFILQRSVCVMKTKNFLNSEFLSLMLTSPALLEWMMDRASGTAQKGIYLKSLRKMPIPVPPLSEQHRIVGKILELFDKLKWINQSK